MDQHADRAPTRTRTTAVSAAARVDLPRRARASPLPGTYQQLVIRSSITDNKVASCSHLRSVRHRRGLPRPSSCAPGELAWTGVRPNSGSIAVAVTHIGGSGTTSPGPLRFVGPTMAPGVISADHRDPAHESEDVKGQPREECRVAPRGPGRPPDAGSSTGSRSR